MDTCQARFCTTLAIVAVAVLLLLASTGYIVFKKSSGTKSTASGVNEDNSSLSASSPQQSATADPSEGGKYLYIKEWSIRILLPDKFKAKVAYTLSDTTDPDSKLPLGAADIYVSSSIAPANRCEAKDTSLGKAITTATTILRSDSSKEINAFRYERDGSHFSANVLHQDGYAFSVSQGTILCLNDPSADFEALQKALLMLEIRR